MSRAIDKIRDTFSSTAAAFSRHCEQVITPLMSAHGFAIDSADKSGSIGTALYRNGDRWIELVVSKHPQDFPGAADMTFGVGPASWPDRQRVAVPLKAYLDVRPAGTCQVVLSQSDDVRTTVENMARLLRDCASDFLAGDHSSYNSALAKHRF